ncbi:uncharacterized protein DNG_03192 [Cephalotrichum gorgonifer]|uniref:Uncharacterized protein n=1 Tax=Cephalotrichum gorgonifer TaxID=2041049 RepID=A0AAE8MWH6_9PEZI|nr:uncharacterized protein DNG_03192 [Cephalotrichum gorgonifer]
MSKPTLFQLRLVSRQLGDIAQRWAYRSLRLEGHGSSAERFAKIAYSPKLRDLVWELTIDTWIGPGFAYHSNEGYKIPEAFMNNLPHLRCFGNLKVLHLRFSEYCGEDDDDRSGLALEETWNFRYRVLDTICHCVAGMWTKERQVQIDKRMEQEWEPGYSYPDEDSSLPSGQVIHLKELTITNLADYHEPALSEAWKKVITLPSLIDLKLLVTTESCDPAPENSIYFKERYEFFENLPRSWLSPAVANNLRVLSLYYGDYWGWFPKMDFRSLALGQDSPFPHLKVLALGNYVFSHEWQVEWLASIGRDNSSGGLEELYLDDCPVLFKARQVGPFSSSDPGYPDPKAVLGPNYNPETREYPMRWNHILIRWAESMKGLKVFRMGHGTWYGVPDDTLMAIKYDGSYDGVSSDVREHHASHQLHRSFACPAPIDEDDDEDAELVWKAGRHLHGAGMKESRGWQMQYIEYDIGLGPTQWIEPRRPYDGPFAPEDGTLAKDDAAFKALMTAIEARASA